MSGEEQNPWRVMNRALADAERMIYYASQGKTEETAELDCLTNLTRATARIKNYQPGQELPEEDAANFFKQLSLLAHIIYPVTAQSLRALEGLTVNSATGATPSKWNTAANRALLLLLFVTSFTCLLLTPYIFTLALTGSNIIERMDAIVQERATLRQELIKEAQGYSKELAAAKPPYPAIDLMHKLEVTTLVLGKQVIQLNGWNNSWFGQLLFPRHSPAEDGEKQNPAATLVPPPGSRSWDEFKRIAEEDPEYNYAKLFLREIAQLPPQALLGENLAIKNHGLLILQALNRGVLLLLFGCCGASAYIMRKTIQELNSHTFTGIRWSTWIRILLGTFSGFFLGYLAGNNDLASLLQSEAGKAGSDPGKISLVSPLAFAFVGGYSVDLLFTIMNRFIYALTNDERYLPANEQVKRKVDVGKFMPPETPVPTIPAAPAPVLGERREPEPAPPE